MSDERDTGETLAFGGDDEGGSWLDELASDDRPKAVTQAPAVAAQVAASQAPGAAPQPAQRPGDTVGTVTRRRRRSARLSGKDNKSANGIVTPSRRPC